MVKVNFGPTLVFYVYFRQIEGVEFIYFLSTLYSPLSFHGKLCP